MASPPRLHELLLLARICSAGQPVCHSTAEGTSCVLGPDAQESKAGRAANLASIPGVVIHVPEVVSHVKRETRPANLPDRCCWNEFQVLYDTDQKPILVSVGDFICNPEEYVDLAIDPEKRGLKWELADIHPYQKEADPVEAKLQGNGFPGTRLHIHSQEDLSAHIVNCLQPVVDVVWPGFDLRKLAQVQHSFGLVSAEKQPNGRWLDAQRTPHNDIQWQFGVMPSTEVVPPMLATVWALTNKFGDSGVGLWRVRRTRRNPEERLSLLETLDVNENVQGGFSQRDPALMLFPPNISTRDEIPDPCPQSVVSHRWAEAIAVSHLIFNRLVMYDGRRLHNQYMEHSACSRLTLLPNSGRLTLNSFFWHSVDTYKIALRHGSKRKGDSFPSEDDTLDEKRRRKEAPRAGDVSSLPGIDVILQDAIARLTKTPRPKELDKACCWESIGAAWDKRGNPIIVSVDNFLCDTQPLTEAAQKSQSRWVRSTIQPLAEESDPAEAALKGSGFPGSWLSLNRNRKKEAYIFEVMEACMQPIADLIWPDFELTDEWAVGHQFNLVSPENLPNRRWIDEHRKPHNEIRWDLGLLPGNRVPPSLVSSLGLTTRFNDTGIGVWRVKGTKRKAHEKLSLLKTVGANNYAQGVFTKGEYGLYNALSVRDEIPDPYPHHGLSNPWAEAIAVVRNSFNRLVLLDGRRLQQDFMEPSAYSRLSLQPAKGRLVLNSYLWQHPRPR